MKLKAALVAFVAMYLTLVVFNNLTDYNSNFQFVKHVLAMDTVFPENQGMWRSIENPFIHHLFYWVIIIWESASAAICWIGAIKCWNAAKQSASLFNGSKGLAVAGLTLSLSMWLFAFITIGGEWFLMWQSEIWNGQDSAFRMFTIMGIILIILILPDHPNNGETNEGR